MLGMMDKSPSTRMKEDDERTRRKATGPGHPAPEDVNNSSSPATEVLQDPDIRPDPGHPAPPASPDIRRPSQNAPEAEPRQPGHPARGPDIRLFVTLRTSGPQLGHPAPACA